MPSTPLPDFDGEHVLPLHPAFHKTADWSTLPTFPGKKQSKVKEDEAKQVESLRPSAPLSCFTDLPFTETRPLAVNNSTTSTSHISSHDTSSSPQCSSLHPNHLPLQNFKLASNKPNVLKLHRARTLSPIHSKPRRPYHVRASSVDSKHNTLKNDISEQGNDVNMSFTMQGHNPTRDGRGHDPPPYSRPSSSHGEKDEEDGRSEATNDPSHIYEEIDSKWILNLSMHMRENWENEKFFITYAEQPNKWRRVSVSCDYRDAEPDSLEADLRTLKFQRDKSIRIYEAIREALPEIAFHDTVTNLKLQTENSRLHVHVTEDVNAIIPYPPISAIDHLQCEAFPESAIHFQSHLSGFVYKVSLGSPDGKSYIKKEIPTPDSVDEFLYEINSLYALRGSPHVIQFIGVVVDDASTTIKGLIIDFADGGALVDLLYNAHAPSFPWPRREAWARQIIRGLADIHEHGFVQGDFTLNNIVVSGASDAAKIIDINRRGCPVGWEPPELSGLLESGQRIGMYIGVKTDLWQLGMVLWGLAMLCDEPEREEELLPAEQFPSAGVPAFFTRVVESCLDHNPAGRLSAKELLALFPASNDVDHSADGRGSSSRERTVGSAPRSQYSDVPYVLDETAKPPDDRGRRFGTPLHQDSGFDEAVFAPLRRDTAGGGGMAGASDLMFVGLGLGAAPAEEDDDNDNDNERMEE